MTPRETDVLRLVCRGANNAELRMRERTVTSHVSALLAELGAPHPADPLTIAIWWLDTPAHGVSSDHVPMINSAGRGASRG
ncbi:LuxR C-terminal-related transcriptional regulator [Goekera deserti]|uniref:LuxR C-terminal-related transcriptional regulator n=1 Tax=Goekera deserti TaxID=2497753 RepID=UPI0039A5C737